MHRHCTDMVCSQPNFNSKDNLSLLAGPLSGSSDVGLHLTIHTHIRLCLNNFSPLLLVKDDRKTCSFFWMSGLNCWIWQRTRVSIIMAELVHTRDGRDVRIQESMLDPGLPFCHHTLVNHDIFSPFPFCPSIPTRSVCVSFFWGGTECGHACGLVYQQYWI